MFVICRSRHLHSASNSHPIFLIIPSKTIRFQECLGTEQASRGELVKKIIVSTGSEIPLSLKRTLSQRCDPHQAYILLELGSFEDTAGRINHQDFEVSSRSRSTTFFYKTAVKIAVDTVGVRRYDLCHKYNRRTGRVADNVSESEDLGYIIVRVDLLGSTKVVSIESPFVLKNNTEVDLLCELRNHGGVSLLWRSLIPRSLTPMPSEKLKMVKRRYISLPADLVPTASTTEATLSVRALSPDSTAKHESEIPQEFGDQFVAVELPPPFSDKSVARGLIKVSQTNLISVVGNEQYQYARKFQHVRSPYWICILSQRRRLSVGASWHSETNHGPRTTYALFPTAHYCQKPFACNHCSASTRQKDDWRLETDKFYRHEYCRKIESR